MKQFIAVVIGLLCLSSCQTPPLTPSERTPTILIPQWHLSPQTNTKTRTVQIPQSENQLSIYDTVSTWTSSGLLKSAVVEGCEGEITKGFNTRFNGWSLRDLEKLKPQDRRSVMTHVGLKLEAEYGPRLAVICGDNLALVKKQLLVLSDLRGLFGFRIRIEEFKNDPTRKAEYLRSVRTLLKLPKNATDAEITAALDQSLKNKIADFELLTAERNASFATAVKTAPHPTAIIIGAIHIDDLKAKLQAQGEKPEVFQPKGLKGDESEVLEEAKRLLSPQKPASTP